LRTYGPCTTNSSDTTLESHRATPTSTPIPTPTLTSIPIPKVEIMPSTVIVGLDGSPESHAAAEWAAREARLRGLPLKLVNVWEPAPTPVAQAPLLGAETQQHWSEQMPREAAEGLRLRHPGVEITAEQVYGRPGEILARLARTPRCSSWARAA
jgi:hypothetical protein